jgi:hypothetical protein
LHGNGFISTFIHYYLHPRKASFPDASVPNIPFF